MLRAPMTCAFRGLLEPTCCGPVGGLWAASWAPVGGLGAILGGGLPPRKSWGPFAASFLAPSWGPLRPLGGASGTFSWPVPGASWAVLDAGKTGEVRVLKPCRSVVDDGHPGLLPKGRPQDGPRRISEARFPDRAPAVREEPRHKRPRI